MFCPRCKIIRNDVLCSASPMEPDFGITSYLSDGEGFACILKHRYEDFIVREIDPQENVVRLKNLTANKDRIAEECSSGMQPELLTTTSEEAADQEWPEFLDKEKIKNLERLVDEDGPQVNIPCDGLEKHQRTAIHNAVRNNLRGKLETNTQTIDGKQCIVAKKTCAQNASTTRKRKHWDHPEGDYCHFTLYKENMDTHQALAIIAKRLHVSQKNVRVAGTKDKRAVTSQRACVYHIEQSRMSSLNRALPAALRVGDFRYSAEDLALGSLWGNRFTIILRGITAAEEHVTARVESWKSKGFLNYYGSQRFGTSETVRTWQVGRALLREEWEEAVDLILKSRHDSDSDWTECYKAWKSSKDPEIALSKLNTRKCRSFDLETQLLTALKLGDHRNFYGAIQKLPRNSRNLYVHSYQSFVWNRIVSRRTEKFGSTLLTGDFVFTDEQSSNSAIKKVTESEVSSCDVINLALPLPAASAQLPDNELAEWYKDILQEDGLTMATFEKRAKEFSIYGDYRRVFINPKDVEYEIVKYEDATLALTLTDMDLIRNPDKKIESKGSATALNIEFSLPAGCYATVALRELTKTDLSKAAQIKRSADYKD